MRHRFSTLLEPHGQQRLSLTPQPPPFSVRSFGTLPLNGTSPISHSRIALLQISVVHLDCTTSRIALRSHSLAYSHRHSQTIIRLIGSDTHVTETDAVTFGSEAEDDVEELNLTVAPLEGSNATKAVESIDHGLGLFRIIRSEASFSSITFSLFLFGYLVSHLLFTICKPYSYIHNNHCIHQSHTHNLFIYKRLLQHRKRLCHIDTTQKQWPAYHRQHFLHYLQVWEQTWCTDSCRSFRRCNPSCSQSDIHIYLRHFRQQWRVLS